MSDLAVALYAIADFLIIISFFAGVVFTVTYMAFFRWNKTKAGRAILMVFVAWTSVALLSLLARYVGADYWGREWLRVAGWSLVVFSMVNLIRVLWYNFMLNRSPLDLETRTNPVPLVGSDEEGKNDERI